MNKTDDPDQVRLREYLDDTEALLADSRIGGRWALIRRVKCHLLLR